MSVQKLSQFHVYLNVKRNLLALLVVYQKHLLLAQQLLEVLERHYKRVRDVLLLLDHRPRLICL